MSATILANLEKLLGGPRDNALLRFSLGNEHLKAGETAQAVARFREATERDPNFTAAWKLLGRSLAAANDPQAALAAYTRGLAVAEARGDMQALKEMTVFAKRLQKQIDAG